MKLKIICSSDRNADNLIPWRNPLGLGMGRFRWPSRLSAICNRNSCDSGCVADTPPVRRGWLDRTIPCLHVPLLYRCTCISPRLGSALVFYVSICLDFRRRSQYRCVFDRPRTNCRPDHKAYGTYRTDESLEEITSAGIGETGGRGIGEGCGR
jgi:hypothetical protein